METESANKEIEGWISSGLMVPAGIMARLEVIVNGYALSEDEESQLQKTLSDTDGQALTPDTLLHLLQTRVGLPANSPQSKETANILFRGLWYLSTLPFPPPPSERGPSQPPPHLIPAQVTRGLAWFLPGRSAAMVQEGNLSRSRTAADHRRILFQSLATLRTPESATAETAEADAAALEARAARNATEGVGQGDWAVINRDADGDEIFHDLLAVMYATQPKGLEWLAPVELDGFRWAAKGVVAQLPWYNKLPLLSSLAIPRATVVAIVRLSLAAAPLLDEEDEDTDDEETERPPKTVAPLPLSGVDDAAVERVAAPFCGGEKEAGLIPWPMFDDALRENVSLHTPPPY
ncbi:uncharacterized protein PG998_008173 [Apiospora kogelbergensis]|uniref:uncharacterized protein n=1 Tax=Apiospora kogelbergensis TaxID=1337665 RepID=UPI00312D5825